MRYGHPLCIVIMKLAFFALQISLFFQKIAAELLGIKLTRAEQEEHQPVVKAEISDAHVPLVTENVSGKRTQSIGAKSAVCILQ